MKFLDIKQEAYVFYLPLDSKERMEFNLAIDSIYPKNIDAFKERYKIM